MESLVTVFCIILIVMAVFLVIAVLMQSGKNHNVSGTIAGGAETFFGRTKGKTIDKALSKATTIVSIIFVLMVLIVYILQSGSGDNTVITPTASSTTTQAATDSTNTTSAATEATASQTEATTEAAS